MGPSAFMAYQGQGFGPLNVKYQQGTEDESLVTKVVKLGAERRVENRFFGMALQLDEPMTITQLGQFDPGKNRGTYSLSLVRAEDNKVLATVDLDMSHAHPDAMGFKYARLAEPIRLDAAEQPVIIYPRGLLAANTYEVRRKQVWTPPSAKPARSLCQKESVSTKFAAGELIFLNLPDYPGSGTDHVPPTPPGNVTKRLATNLGVQGIELKWSPSHDDNWISYYEVRKDGKLIGQCSKGNILLRSLRISSQ